jgi:DNA (cytosine-5)-methyltransferase 1
LISLRKITPREAWRLMGWKDSRIDLVINEFSDAQLYKMAGNGIVINVLKEMLKKLEI